MLFALDQKAGERNRIGGHQLMMGHLFHCPKNAA
jgi:hypothetical protein